MYLNVSKMYDGVVERKSYDMGRLTIKWLWCGDVHEGVRVLASMFGLKKSSYRWNWKVVL